MSDQIRIAIDAMGGDGGPTVTVPASISYLQNYPQTEFHLFGDELLINEALAKFEIKTLQSKLTIVPCASLVTDDDRPSMTLRVKQDSSMAQAVRAI